MAAALYPRPHPAARAFVLLDARCCVSVVDRAVGVTLVLEADSQGSTPPPATSPVYCVSCMYASSLCLGVVSVCRGRWRCGGVEVVCALSLSRLGIGVNVKGGCVRVVGLVCARENCESGVRKTGYIAFYTTCRKRCTVVERP